MDRVFFALGALSALLAVAAGAFGSHALRNRLAPDTLGIFVIFSGSLYLLSFTGHRWLGAVTPLGGLAFILGWAALAWAALRGA